jgi:hypothetical protein
MMNTRNLSIGAGSALTTFLVVGVSTIELLGAGEAPAIGILGVFAGAVGGLLVGAIVTAYADRLAGLAAVALVAYAVFGVTFVGIWGMRYVNVPAADDVFSFPVHLAVSVVLAVAAGLLASRGEVGNRKVIT